MSSKNMYCCMALVSYLSLGCFDLRGVQADFKQSVIIDHPLIKVMDGTKNINFAKMLTLENNIKIIQEGDRSGKGLIDYLNRQITLNSLAEIEISGHADKGNIDQAIDDTLKQFKNVSKDYLDEARGFKQMMLVLIQHWAELRGRENSQLCQWGKQPAGEEFEFLKKSVTTAAALHRFLLDLACFMKDLRNSCPKSTKEFKRILAEIKAGKAKGDL